ncbi:hypothetical protein F5Y16DRAFT_373251 [Xylariaceae sp. FL0255]|nr:hypothetical protein F5Y16DRAFT_373251 [Xylariaceae sp. FL0255]
MAARARYLESLPDEILLHVFQFLDARDIVKLQSLSQEFLRICQDNTLWRARCLETSVLHEQVALFRQGSEWIDEDGVTANGYDLQHHSSSHSSTIGNFESLVSTRRDKEYHRIMANWDPTFPGEHVNWYDEYIHRHAKISSNWFEKPLDLGGSDGLSVDVRGVALFNPPAAPEDLFAVSPLDDGSVCLWDVRGSKTSKGAILSRSKAGLLWNRSKRLAPQRLDRGIVECVSVDSDRGHAFFAVGYEVVEVDLQSLAVVSRAPFEWMIMTISEASPTVPLTVGTLKGLHLHDYRGKFKPRNQHVEVIDDLSELHAPYVSKVIQEIGSLPPYAALAQPGPQAIHHPPTAGDPSQLSDDIFVVGRFTSMLHYDRRMFPSIKGSMHSGGHLCSLTSLPYPFSSIDSLLRRRLQLTEEQVQKSKSSPGGRTIIACGEYKTKGSLEIYGLSDVLEGGLKRVSYDSTMKNRVSASQSKLLSVINHGNRIVFSDGQGYLKWFERDGFGEVRRHKIGQSEKITERSIFSSMPGSDEIARKLVSTRVGINDNMPNNDDILFWTGETLGLATFSSSPSFAAEDFITNAKTPEEMAVEEEERLYSERVRLALERQADEVRYVQNLGVGNARNPN